MELTASPKLRGLQKYTTLSTIHNHPFNEVLNAATIAAGEGVGVKVPEALIGGRNSPVTASLAKPANQLSAYNDNLPGLDTLGLLFAVCLGNPFLWLSAHGEPEACPRLD